MSVVTNSRHWQFSVDSKNMEDARRFLIYDLRVGRGIDELSGL